MTKMTNDQRRHVDANNDQETKMNIDDYSGTLNQAVYVFHDKYLGEAYFPVSVGAKK